MPGEKQYIAGPSCVSGAIALQAPTSDDPNKTAGLEPATRFVS
jgi:hypothetical protein